MITATKPTSPLFTSSLDTFTFKISGDTATVTIKCNGMELLSETYYPVSGSITIYDLGTLIADAVRPTVTASFTIDITEHQGESDIATWSSGAIIAYYATVDIDMSCPSFIDRYFLTLLDGTKLTRLGHREYLHAAGIHSSTPTVVAQFFKDNQVTTVQVPSSATPTHTANGITSFDVSPDRYCDASEGDLFAYTVTVGDRTQQYQIDHTGSIADPVLLFTNSFGCQEIFYCLGKKKIAPIFERKSAVIGGKKINYQVKETRTFEGDTGIIPPSMAHFAETCCAPMRFTCSVTMPRISKSPSQTPRASAPTRLTTSLSSPSHTSTLSASRMSCSKTSTPLQARSSTVPSTIRSIKLLQIWQTTQTTRPPRPSTSTSCAVPSTSRASTARPLT